MHVVGELQRRPSKKRHATEKLMGSLYDVALVVKYVTFLILISTTTIAAKRTFDDGFWNPGSYRLATTLNYKFSSCEYSTVRHFYAFHNVSMTLTRNNNAELMTDYAGQLRTLIILTGLTLVLGAVNREIFRNNRFFIRYRHLYFHKDVVTTVEVLLLSWIFYIAFHLTEQQTLLQDYFHACRLQRATYLPFVSLTPEFVFVGVHAGMFVIASIVLVYNTLNSDALKAHNQQNGRRRMNNPNALPGALGSGGGRESSDPTAVCQADLHEEPDDVNSLTDRGSEADHQQPYEQQPFQNTYGGGGDQRRPMYQNPLDDEEMQFAAMTGGAPIPDAAYSYRSPTRTRTLTSPTGFNNTYYPGQQQQRQQQQQRAYLQHRPQPLQRPASNRSSVYHYGREATPMSTMGARRMGTPALGPSTQPRSSTLPPQSQQQQQAVPMTTNAGSVPPPPPPHQSFYLYQQPNSGASPTAMA
jgi:hypothetical protein